MPRLSSVIGTGNVTKKGEEKKNSRWKENCFDWYNNNNNNSQIVVINYSCTDEDKLKRLQLERDTFLCIE